VALGLDQARLAQDLEVVGDQRLGGTQPLGEVADAQLLAGQQADDAPAQRLAERAGKPGSPAVSCFRRRWIRA
jgi:hypothetical protein